MQKIRTFQRVMLVLLTGINAFVFMSMKGVSLQENMLYTLLSISVVLILIGVATRVFRITQKKSSSIDQ